MPLRPHQIDATKAMFQHAKGQIIIPTGGGKTMCMIDDAKKGGTIVVVAPRILLAEQLSSEFLEQIDNVSVMHVHSGETHHYSSTKVENIYEWYKRTKGNLIRINTHAKNTIIKIEII